MKAWNAFIRAAGLDFLQIVLQSDMFSSNHTMMFEDIDNREKGSAP